MRIETLYQLDPTEAVQRWLCWAPLDPVMKAASIAGEGWFLLLMMFVIAWRGNGDPGDARRSALRGLLVLAVTGALVVACKRYAGTARPLEALGPTRIRVLLEPLRHHSFPSGHSAGSAAFALWASRVPPRRRWPWLFAFLVGLSRVYVGAHWVTDVLAGWTLGLLVAAAVHRFWPVPRGAPTAPAAAGEGAP